MHISVLKDELINNLNLKEDSIIVDGTLGYAGDSSIILERIKKGFLFAFDQDSEAIEYSTNVLNKIGTNFTIIKSNFVRRRASRSWNVEFSDRRQEPRIFVFGGRRAARYENG